MSLRFMWTISRFKEYFAKNLPVPRGFNPGTPLDLVKSFEEAIRADERERIYAYANDPNNPYYSYDYSPDGFYLKASRLREFIKSGKEWVNPTHATPKRPVLSPAPKEEL